MFPSASVVARALICALSRAFPQSTAGADLYTKWISKIQPWSVIRSAVWGHGQLAIVNRTTAHWTWYDHSKAAGTVGDAVTITCKAQV